MEGFAEKEGFKSVIKEREGDEKLIIICVAVRGINDHIRFYSQRLCRIFNPPIPRFRD